MSDGFKDGVDWSVRKLREAAVEYEVWSRDPTLSPTKAAEYALAAVYTRAAARILREKKQP